MEQQKGLSMNIYYDNFVVFLYSPIFIILTLPLIRVMFTYFWPTLMYINITFKGLPNLSAYYIIIWSWPCKDVP